MLQTLIYIILFLLGYKIIKELFKEEPRPECQKIPQDRMRVNPTPNPAAPKQYTEAEMIDYEEVK